jgi:tryptophan synthase beta chain
MKTQFGQYGGQFVPPLVVKALDELEKAFYEAIEDESFLEEFRYYLKDFVGRPSPLYFCENLTKKYNGAKIYLKREDLNHTGAHKINNTIGQILLAKRMGKTKIIAETGAGQHGVASATAAAMFGMECEVCQGQVDIERQELNVFKMELLGAKVTSVTQGTKTLADAVDFAINKWVEHIDDTFYLLGSAVGPHPYPTIVKYFQKIIGEETKRQVQEKEGRLPDYLVACVGGGSNAIGLFTDFLKNKEVKMVGVEAAGKGVDTTMHAATMAKGTVGIIHGMNTKVILNEKGQIAPVYSISAGLDYPGVGPEHAFLEDEKRVKYESCTDAEAVEAFLELSREEGIIPAIESAHAVSYGAKLASSLTKDKIVVINLSGRGDKDVNQIKEYIDSQDN